MKVGMNPGLYMIRCRANGATYVGAAKALRRRLQGQLSSLANRANGCELLQEDWCRFTPEQFEIKVLEIENDDPFWLEADFIEAAGALEEVGGYNKSLGRDRSIPARIRDTERKLINKGKFELLHKDRRHERIASVFVDSFCQKTRPLRHELRESWMRRMRPVDRFSASSGPTRSTTRMGTTK